MRRHDGQSTCSYDPSRAFGPQIPSVPFLAGAVLVDRNGQRLIGVQAVDFYRKQTEARPVIGAHNLKGE